MTEALFGIEPVLINSALVSAQNRKRLYWVGKRNEDGTYSKVDVPQPEDRGIVLRDILEPIPLDAYIRECDRLIKLYDEIEEEELESTKWEPIWIPLQRISYREVSI